MRVSGLFALAVLAAALPGAAGAVTIRVSWAGAIDVVRLDVGAELPLGTPVSGSFLIDTSIADTQPDPQSGLYPGAATDIVFHFGSYEYHASTGTVGIANTLGDAFSLYVGAFGVPLAGAAPIAGSTIEGIGFSIESGPGALQSDAIPLALALAPFHGGAFVVPLGGGSLFGSDTSSLSYEAVPEPGTGVLVGLGALGLVHARRREGSHRDA